MLTAKDYLHAEGTDIVNAAGEKVMLRGENFGGWLLREGWLDAGGACRKPRTVEKKERDGSVIFWKISDKAWNRLVFTEKGKGSFIIEASGDGINYEVVYGGCFEKVCAEEVPDGQPGCYGLGKRMFNHGAWFDGVTVSLNEVYEPFVKLTFLAGNPEVDAELFLYENMDDYGTRKLLRERFGKEGEEEILAAYQKNYITEKDLNFVKSLSLNLIRIPIYWQVILNEDGSVKENAFRELDWVIEEAGKRDIYVMPDYHGAPGGHTMGSITCGQLGSNELWTNKWSQEMSCKIISLITERYKGNPAVAFIDLLNEPALDNPRGSMTVNEKGEFHLNAESCRAIRDMYDMLYKASREADPDRMLVLQPFMDEECLGDPADKGWTNVVYQLHSYGLGPGGWRNHDGVKASMLRYLEQHRKVLEMYRVPLFAGEFCFWEFDDIWKEWLKGLNAMGVHWMPWSYKVADINKTDNWSVIYHFDGELVDYYNDSKEEILRKISAFSSDHYHINTGYAAFLKEAAEE